MLPHARKNLRTSPAKLLKLGQSYTMSGLNMIIVTRIINQKIKNKIFMISRKHCHHAPGKHCLLPKDIDSGNNRKTIRISICEYVSMKYESLIPSYPLIIFINQSSTEEIPFKCTKTAMEVTNTYDLLFSRNIMPFHSCNVGICFFATVRHVSTGPFEGTLDPYIYKRRNKVSLRTLLWRFFLS